MTLPLVVEGLSVWVPSRPLIHSLKFNVLPGTVTCVLGPTGSGKTRLLETLAGTATDWAGEIILSGKSQSILHHRRRARLRSVLLPVDQYPFPLSVEQRVAVAMRRRRHSGFMRPPDWSDRVDYALAVCELLDHRHTPLSDLTVEVGRRVDFASLIAQNAPLWLLDEPNNYLPRDEQATFLQRIVALIKESQAGCIMTLHDTGLARQFADQVITLTGQGETMVGPPSQILKPESLAELTGRPVIDSDRDSPVELH